MSRCGAAGVALALSRGVIVMGAAVWTIHYSLAPLGAAVLTGAADRFGAPGPLLAVAVIYVAVVAVAAFTPIRGRNPEDHPVATET